jgi:hypothetical protein
MKNTKKKKKKNGIRSSAQANDNIIIITAEVPLCVSAINIFFFVIYAPSPDK